MVVECQKRTYYFPLKDMQQVKIITKDDLFNIRTYGFRGEALSSIASVSKMILSSRTEDSPNGTQMNVLGGKVTNLKYTKKM